MKKCIKIFFSKLGFTISTFVTSLTQTNARSGNIMAHKILWPVAPHPIHNKHRCGAFLKKPFQPKTQQGGRDSKNGFKFKLLKYMLRNQDRWTFCVAEPDDGRIFTGNVPLVGLTIYCSSKDVEDLKDHLKT